MKEKTGCIYEIRNIINGKTYIGQTIASPMSRWKDHYTMYKSEKNESPLYSEMQQYGIESFIFHILESDIPESNLDEKEKHYVSKFKSNIDGYNITAGGNHTSVKEKLTVDVVKEIIEMIKNGVQFKSIAEIYHIDRSTVSNINNGDIWHMDDVTYPIVKSIYDKKHFSEEDIDTIYELLRDNNTAKSIGMMFDTSTTTISKINNGLIYARDGESYPINKASTRPVNLKKDMITKIAYDLANTTENYVSISRKFSVGRKTISGINNGLLYEKILKDLGYTEFPIRKQ